MDEEIQELTREIASLESRVEELEEELRPVWDAENGIKDSIRRTHGGRPGIDPIRFNPAGAEARHGLFARLLGIAIEHGGTKAQRSELSSRLRAYVRRRDTLKNELEREKNRAKRKSSAKTAPVQPTAPVQKKMRQGELF
jgi:hypothetical protein